MTKVGTGEVVDVDLRPVIGQDDPVDLSDA